MHTGLSAIPQRRLRCAVLACAVVAWMLGGIGVKSVEAQCQYEVTTFAEGPNCGVLGPASVHFFGLNEHGQACGRRSICGEVGQWLPIVWTEEQGLITLPLPEGATQGEANDINNVLGSDGFGQVACTLSVPALGGDQAFLYDDGTWVHLGLLPGAMLARPEAINDNSEIVGDCEYPNSRHPSRAFFWQSGVMSPIDLPSAPETSARAISETSSVVGWEGESTVDNSGFLQTVREIIEIPLLPDAVTGESTGISNTSSAVGSGRLPTKSGPAGRRAWLYDGSVLSDLGLLGGMTHAAAADICDHGQVIGRSFVTTGASEPFLWQDGELLKLKDLTVGVPGFFKLAAAKAINNRGQIAGYTGGSAEGIILTPNVPLGDVTLDCEVDADDLIAVLDAWGPCDDAGSIADIVTSQSFQPPADGVVDGADLAVVLGNWTDRSATLTKRN